MVKSKSSMEKEENKSFSHFKIHTQYSICEGAIKIDDLKNFCKDKKIKSIGLSDTSNLCGALEFSDNISKSGTQPIIGTQIVFNYNNELGLLPLIAKNEIAYKKIVFLSSKSYLEKEDHLGPNCKFDDLINNSDDVIVLSGSIAPTTGHPNGWGLLPFLTRGYSKSRFPCAL